VTAAFPRTFSPITVGHLTLANRLCHVATLTNFAEANRPGQRHVDYYAARARGGVGMIVTEAIAVHPKSVPMPSIIAGWDRASVDGLTRISDAVHAHGVPIVGQLWHLGRQQLWTPVSAPWAPSAIPDPHSGTIPHAMTPEEIDEVVESHATTARNMQDATFDGVELHGAHGYLITQFLSPWSNRRDDDYGGSLENRLRFVRQIVDALRATCGRRFVVGLKLNAHELVAGGIDLAESRRIATALVGDGGLDYFAVSQGNFSKTLEAHAPDMHFPRLAFRELARGIKEVAGGVPVCVMARVVSPEDAEDALASGDGDFVGMSRALVADAELPMKARHGRADRIRPCISCNVCWGAVAAGKPITCLYNPSVGHEAAVNVDQPPAAVVKRRVVVVGGGLAGLEAARVAALRGHGVVLLEKSSVLGGQANLAAQLPGRAEFGRMTAWLIARVRELPVDVRLGVEATPELVLGLEPDAVVIATGSLPPEPRLESEDPAASGPMTTVRGALPRITTAWDVIAGSVNTGDSVAVIDRDGEHEGAGVAELLADQGKRVWVVTPYDYVGFHLNYLSRIGVTRRLANRDVTVLPSMQPRRFEQGTLVLEHLYTRHEQPLDGIDTVVLAGGNRAVAALGDALRGKVAELHLIGDCYAPRKAAAAVHEGHRVGRIL
jgi:2,4-dienoyl-CoA reductase-like NADH-dependent reductase (Old Yellow Enzyme family)